MKLFPYGHATHPDWHMAAGLVLAQLRAQMAQGSYARSPTLALLYITDHYAGDAQNLLDHLSAELPEVTDWAGTVGVGIASNNVEYFDEPALVVMLLALPPQRYRVFSGVAPLSFGFDAHTALVHADANMPDAAGLIAEMAARTSTGYLFGGLAASRTRNVQFAAGGDGNMRGQGAAGGVFSGGLSGVAFDADVQLLSRVTQGCQPVSAARTVTASESNVVLMLDGEPALDVLLEDLGVTLDQPRAALAALRQTLVGLSAPGSDAVTRTGAFGNDVLVRHIIGLDPGRRGGRVDLVRICAEIREELEPEQHTLETATALAASEAERAPHPARRIAGAVYVSCAGRGGPHFGAPSAELQIVRHALGDVPLVGFFAGGEIAREHLYGYTGVLTVFTADN